jgi:saccharopine dehydrogenase (NAD+, L-lysine-forming)
MKCILIRKETVENEIRTPLIPKDVERLIQNGYTIYVQSSKTRIYPDSQYEKAGAIITEKPWHTAQFNNYLIIGLKALPDLDQLNNHTHIYFSHSFKNQQDSKLILETFKNSNSTIYDFEYFMDPQTDKRFIGFGYYAGIVGAVLGLKQYITKNINELQAYTSLDELKVDIHQIDAKIALIGSEGCCGSGVRHILDNLKIPYTTFSKNATLQDLPSYDIIYNCILLDQTYNVVWFDESTHFTKPLIIADISCDYSKPNNPIKLYSSATTWSKPVHKPNPLVSIIAIDNLPSLLPKECSDRFSSKCTDLLLDQSSQMWSKCYDKFINAVQAYEKNHKCGKN